MPCAFLPQPLAGRINFAIDFFDEREFKSELRTMVLWTKRNSAVTLAGGGKWRDPVQD